ncbi:inovirus-type Gp2 protein [Pectobacterium versatile]|uniref:Inovirus-type Gp2 protein n=2 Tax=Pectobacterium versatile TaxID=2488639 RepID=A0A855MD75_9GAMM|nr:inovirus-type Gp2 protein [Pectobacterium aquaticum]MCH5051065.1 inovirus-type Gp2 protein [Pectobacterium aquaticum]POY48515.1 hypothetical protein F131LOC_03738 [Pectobacterium versatile]QPK14395.1 inovirus-type Gp2 protein [Pectobacterium versatile]
MRYPRNPNYTMDTKLLSELTNHMELMRERYSDIIPLRMDFAYKKTSQSFRARYRDQLDMDMYRLAERVLIAHHVIGYAWVMECTELHGLHFHAMFYLDGQRKRNSYLSARVIADEWRNVTDDQGIFHNCQRDKYHKVDGGRCLHYSDKAGYKNLAFILSYMAKKEQKYDLDIKAFNVSEVPVRSNRGRPRKPLSDSW